ncbi:hypothetical protein SynBIOSE41_01684 [Synechococcus sp. BIOS-E4-1]|nr:hypothetical protein SynBIOSE41_01684 [Synechococcus sp. BIOS-E4-1]
MIPSTFRNDVSHEVGINPLDDSRVYFSNLEEFVRRRITSSSPAVEYLSHIPVLRWCLAGQVFTPHTDGHPWFDVQEQGAVPELFADA